MTLPSGLMSRKLRFLVIVNRIRHAHSDVQTIRRESHPDPRTHDAGLYAVQRSGTRHVPLTHFGELRFLAGVVPGRRHQLRHSRKLTRLCSPQMTQRPPEGGDDNALRANGLAAVPSRPAWVTLAAHKWVGFRGRRGDISGGKVLWRGARCTKNRAGALFRLAAQALHRDQTPIGQPHESQTGTRRRHDRDGG